MVKRKAAAEVEEDGESGDGELQQKPAKSRGRPKKIAEQKSPAGVQKKELKKPKAKGKSKAKQADDGAPCVVCGEPRYMRFIYCQRHKNLYSVMKYQADNAEPPCTDEFVALIDDPMQGPPAMKEYERNEAGIVKFKKGQTCKFGNWFKEWRSKKSKSTIDDVAPFEKEEWIILKTTTCGWPRALAEEWWNDFESGELYECGVNSFGRPCMWLPLKPVRRKQNEIAVESAFRESSGDLKNLKQEDANAFRALAQNSTSSFQDAFFDKKFNVQDTKNKKPWSTQAEVDASDDDDVALAIAEPGCSAAGSDDTPHDKRLEVYSACMKQIRALKLKLAIDTAAAKEIINVKLPEAAPVLSEDIIVRGELEMSLSTKHKLAELVMVVEQNVAGVAGMAAIKDGVVAVAAEEKPGNAKDDKQSTATNEQVVDNASVPTKVDEAESAEDAKDGDGKDDTKAEKHGDEVGEVKDEKADDDGKKQKGDDDGNTQKDGDGETQKGNDDGKTQEDDDNGKTQKGDDDDGKTQKDDDDGETQKGDDDRKTQQTKEEVVDVAEMDDLFGSDVESKVAGKVEAASIVSTAQTTKQSVTVGEKALAAYKLTLKRAEIPCKEVDELHTVEWLELRANDLLKTEKRSVFLPLEVDVKNSHKAASEVAAALKKAMGALKAHQDKIKKMKTSAVDEAKKKMAKDELDKQKSDLQERAARVDLQKGENKLPSIFQIKLETKTFVMEVAVRIMEELEDVSPDEPYVVQSGVETFLLEKELAKAVSDFAASYKKNPKLAELGKVNERFPATNLKGLEQVSHTC